MKVYWEVDVYSSIHSLTSALDGGEWSALRPGRFTPREGAPGTPTLVGPQSRSGHGCEEIIPNPCRDSNPRSSSFSVALYR
jgi:hypothetical protein